MSGIYPAYAEGSEEIRRLLSGYPPEILKAFGFDVQVIFTPIGFYSMIFTYIVLCGSIQAMITGISLISKEFNRKTADFLLTKPASRSKILSGKVLAGIVSLFITDTIVTGAVWLIIKLSVSEPIDFGSYMTLSATLFYIGMMFFALGVITAVIVQRIKSVIGVSIGTVFGFFAVGMVGIAYDDDKIRYLVPFKYYDPIKIISSLRYERVFVAINILFVVFSIAAGYFIYVKRDIHSA
jgi:ABC-2 type transport system permease protein